MRRLLSFLIIVLILSLAGCQERKSSGSVTLEKPADLKLAVSARFLRSDGSWYLTQQQHDITIEPKAIKIIAQEPFGKIILNVQNGQFNLQKSSGLNDFDKQLCELMTDEGICKALLELYLAELKNVNVPTTTKLITGNKRYILFGYNYLKFKEDGYFPSKIDVYAFSEGSEQKMIAQYEGRLL
ncbi:MAG: hypothetical protein ABSE89_03805 [Sedimentisphaerales bacterium]